VPVFPCVPKTITSTPLSTAAVTIICAGSPRATSAFATTPEPESSSNRLRIRKQCRIFCRVNLRQLVCTMLI
jgi:hypothetical protein